MIRLYFKDLTLAAVKRIEWQIVKEKWIVHLGDHSVLWMRNKVIHTRMGTEEMERSDSIGYTIEEESVGFGEGIGHERCRRKTSRMSPGFYQELLGQGQ